MSYRFLPADASVPIAVRRIATSQLDNALRALSSADPDAPVTIHGVRKSVKKLRGLIRLARPGFRDYDTENAALRAVGQSLAHLRDSDVMRQTLADLADGTDAFPAMAAALSAHAAATRDPGETHRATTSAREALAAIASRVPHWRIRGRDFDTPARALARSHDRAQAALAALSDPPTPDELHDWRKRAKDVQYQLQLIEPFWPSVIGLRMREMDRLTELLGLHNDLSVLLDRAAVTSLPPDEAMHLSTRAHLRQAQILAKARPLGARLFAGNARAMADLWTELWWVWRGEGG
jgi:CHAD domain-containing protein